ncbi:hypothetical protein KM043_000419 [Ampulex compressa]|nr:hypothetical protein KM043_000419 [Ampulex compressa]
MRRASTKAVRRSGAQTASSPADDRASPPKIGRQWGQYSERRKLSSPYSGKIGEECWKEGRLGERHSIRAKEHRARTASLRDGHDSAGDDRKMAFERARRVAPMATLDGSRG